MKITKTAVVKKAVGLSVPSYSVTGEKKGTASLPEAVFGQKTNKVVLAQAVRVFLSNQRSAHAKTKGRGEVARSTRKIYRQKGTGGARHGPKSAPLFVGGGIAHGPHVEKNYDRVLPKKMRKLALVSALSSKLKSGGVVVVDIAGIEPKTKNIAQMLKKAEFKRPITLVHTNNNGIYKAARNIKGVSIIPADLLTAYEVLAGKTLVLTQEAVEALASRVKKS